MNEAQRVIVVIVGIAPRQDASEDGVTAFIAEGPQVDDPGDDEHLGRDMQGNGARARRASLEQQEHAPDRCRQRRGRR